jgi:Putative restriction endonuclease
MTVQEAVELAFYPEEYLLWEAELSDSAPQSNMLLYLISVLKNYYVDDKWMLAHNRNLKHPEVRNKRNIVTPDLAVYKGIFIPEIEQARMTTYIVNPPRRPAPPVVFEACSKDTWRSDIGTGEKQKVAIYRRIGVKEYFAYDANYPMIIKDAQGKSLPRRLYGWRYANGLAISIQPDPRHNNRLWSQELDSWLEEDGFYIHLYDRNGILRLPADEELAIVRQISEDKIRRLEQEREMERQARLQAEKIIQQMQQEREADRKVRLELEKIIEELKKEKGIQ